MNSDKFDRIVLDLLYGELDELTTAAAKRHMDQSARAREIFAHFKATRQLSVLPTHEPPPDFEAALMERERRALAELPLHHRIGRVVSMLAGYAMRPQLSMGALLLLMIGSSLMFLRARPGQHSTVQVTERGAPESDIDLVLPVASAMESSPALERHPARAARRGRSLRAAARGAPGDGAACGRGRRRRARPVRPGTRALPRWEIPRGSAPLRAHQPRRGWARCRGRAVLGAGRPQRLRLRARGEPLRARAARVPRL